MVETLVINACINDFKVPTNMQVLNSNAWLLILLGIFSFYGQLTLTKALKIEEAGLVSITRASSEVYLAIDF